MGAQTPADNRWVRGNFKMSRETHVLLVWLQGCSWLSNTFLLEGRLSWCFQPVYIPELSSEQENLPVFVFSLLICG